MKAAGEARPTRESAASRLRRALSFEKTKKTKETALKQQEHYLAINKAALRKLVSGDESADEKYALLSKLKLGSSTVISEIENEDIDFNHIVVTYERDSLENSSYYIKSFADNDQPLYLYQIDPNSLEVSRYGGATRLGAQDRSLSMVKSRLGNNAKLHPALSAKALTSRPSRGHKDFKEKTPS